MYFLNLPTEGVSPAGWPGLWMNKHFRNLIKKKMGSWNPHSHHGKEGSRPPWAVNRDCMESPHTTSTWQEQSRDLNREAWTGNRQELGDLLSPSGQKKVRRGSEADQNSEQRKRWQTKFSRGKQAFSQNDIRAMSTYRERRNLN